MNSICKHLNVDIIRIPTDGCEFDDIVKAFLKSGTLSIDAATDIGLISTLYRYAEKYKIKYILEGHSFRTEGIQPLSWAYVDGKFIDSIHKQFGTIPIKTFPNLWMKDFLRWTSVARIKRIRPLYYLDYNKEKAKKELEPLGFQDYGGHHLENKWSAFNYLYYLPLRARVDGRKNEICAYIRQGLLTKKAGRTMLAQDIVYPASELEHLLARLNITREEMRGYIDAPIVNWSKFNTYKPFFEKTRSLWYLLYKTNTIPKSFYYKYCK